ncbi:MAG: hypothetical protein WB660_08455, partial [Candidatus Sulfotelmatobacter sp.]
VQFFCSTCALSSFLESLPILCGYQTFETDINPLANQKVEIRTESVKTGAPLAGPLVKTETGDTKPPSVVREAAVPPQR